MEVDRIAEALAVAESSRGVLHPLDLGVDALGASVGDALETRDRRWATDLFLDVQDHPNRRGAVGTEEGGELLTRELEAGIRCLRRGRHERDRESQRLISS